MKPYLYLAAPILLFGLAACTGTPQKGMIPGSTYQLELLGRTQPTGSEFTRALTADYRTLALYEWGDYDWLAQQIFAKKGLAAAAGTAVPPEQLAEWSVSDPAAAADLKVARTHLMAVLAPDESPSGCQRLRQASIAGSMNSMRGGKPSGSGNAATPSAPQSPGLPPVTLGPPCLRRPRQRLR